MNALKKEIVGILVTKLLLLFILWYVCFSHPIAKKIDTGKLAERLIGSSTVIHDVPTSPMGSSE